MYSTVCGYACHSPPIFIAAHEARGFAPAHQIMRQTHSWSRTTINLVAYGDDYCRRWWCSAPKESTKLVLLFLACVYPEPFFHFPLLILLNIEPVLLTISAFLTHLTITTRLLHASRHSRFRLSIRTTYHDDLDEKPTTPTTSSHKHQFPHPHTP